MPNPTLQTDHLNSAQAADAETAAMTAAKPSRWIVNRPVRRLKDDS